MLLGIVCIIVTQFLRAALLKTEVFFCGFYETLNSYFIEQVQVAVSEDGGKRI